MVYSQHLIFSKRDELIDRLHYTVNLFRDYLFDDSLEFCKGMEKEQEMLKNYIISEDYDGLTAWYLQIIQSQKKKVLAETTRKIVLYFKRNWIYLRY